MIYIRQWLLSTNKRQKYKRQQLLKALKLSYSSRKRKAAQKIIFSSVKRIQWQKNNIGINSSLPIIFHDINLNWLLKKEKN